MKDAQLLFTEGLSKVARIVGGPTGGNGSKDLGRREMLVYIMLIDGEVDSVMDNKTVAEQYAAKMLSNPYRTPMSVVVIERLVYRG